MTAPKLAPLRLAATSCCQILLAICCLFLIMPTISCSQFHQADLVGLQFTCGKLYYRTFHMDQQRNVLYVGAM